MIYFMLNEFRNAIKIGYASTLNGVEFRLIDHQVSNVDRLTMIAAIDGTMKEEKELHRRFKRFHRRGEWFTDCEEIRAFISEHYDFYVTIREQKRLAREMKRQCPTLMNQLLDWAEEQRTAKENAGEFNDDAEIENEQSEEIFELLELLKQAKSVK
jgi:hypothetical protein